jgi:tetratricopeptide (TPR) repeat protein
VPQNADYWNTLGVCRYRVGDWHGAIAALQKSSELDRYDEEWSNAFFLAMAHWQLGNKDEAHRWYGRAVERVDRKRPTSENLVRCRSEAAELLGVKKKKGSEPSSTPTQ